jgi:deazaflavin-dependent oxidoreductase (nitroreductase family)
MAQDEETHDSPVDWVAKHIAEYVETGGRQRNGTRPMLLLTTRGRRSGKLRRTALTYWPDGDRYVVVGSNGGAARHPAWYLNLTANPEVTLQVGTESFPARASTASPEEKPRLWSIVVADMPMYDSFQRKTRRDIPVVVLERR